MKTEKTIRVIVISPDTDVSTFLKNSLRGSWFEVVACRPQDELGILAAGAHIAIIDRIDERPVQAGQEISVLKRNSVELPIIAISQHSTERDATVVNEGIFYYLAGFSKSKLLRVIHAAADSLRDKYDEFAKPTK